MEQQSLQRLNQLADHLAELYKPIRSAYYTAPTNRSIEKQKLLDAYAKDKPYNPHFTYHTPPLNWNTNLENFLQKLNPDANIWEYLLHRDIVTILKRLKAIETRDPQLLTQLAIESYGEVTEELVGIARQELDNLPVMNEIRDISATEMAHAMREAVDMMLLNNWSILIDKDMNARMSVRSVEKQIKINAKQLFSVNDLKRLLVHEIGTHVFRSVNGSLQSLKLLQMGLYDYMSTEEGLANYHESHYGVQTPSVQRLYALRVIAAYKSLSCSFYDVFNELVQYINPDEAFDITVRAKRGFSDTSVSGCYIKDKVYFEGFLMVSNHLKRSPEDYLFLMCGKVSLKIIPALKDLHRASILKQPEYLPKKLLQLDSLQFGV